MQIFLKAFDLLNIGPVPDEITICKFRRFREKHNLGVQLLYPVNQYLKENGMKVSQCTFIDASIIARVPKALSAQKCLRHLDLVSYVSTVGGKDHCFCLSCGDFLGRADDFKLVLLVNSIDVVGSFTPS